MITEEIKRGDIVFVDNQNKKPHGHVVYGNHPAVVIQNNVGNEHSSTTIITYITSQVKRIGMPTHVVLQWYDGLRKPSMVQAEQIATIDRGDILGVIDHLRPEDMMRIDKALIASLAIGEV